MNSTKVDVQFKNMKGAAGRSAPVAVVNKIGVTGVVTITRPQNVTPYAAGDAIGQADTVTPANAGSAILKFADMGAKGAVLKINGVDLMVFLAAVLAGMGSFTLHLYNALPAARLDNDGPWDLLAADRTKYLGSIVIGAPADLGSTLYVENNAVGKQVKLADDSADLYGVLVTAGAYTPGAGDVMQLRLQAESIS